jgi:hypothetical protein
VRNDEALAACAVERAVARHGRREGSDEAQSRLGAVIGDACGAHAGGGCDGGEAACGVAVHQVLLHGGHIGLAHHRHAALGCGHGVGRCGCNTHPALARVRHRHAQLGGGARAQNRPRERHASHGQAQRAAGCRLQSAGPAHTHRDGVWRGRGAAGESAWRQGIRRTCKRVHGRGYAPWVSEADLRGEQTSDSRCTLITPDVRAFAHTNARRTTTRCAWHTWLRIILCGDRIRKR